MIYVILGFLCLRSLTQYDILKALKNRISPFYQPSLGSIQTTLKKLISSGWITQKSELSGRRKTLYTITQDGRDAFERWMLHADKDMLLNRFDAELSTRLFFLGLMSPAQRLEIVGNAMAFLDAALSECAEADSVYRQTHYAPEVADVAKYQLKTLSFAMHQLKSTRDWLHVFYQELEEII